ncbi:hypothetical protein AUEXF2481DRAFT_443766 [Aureobasidium subglaciale EXF-2481]|uniref:Uncharacterized protein n=1 Tax=Aureobasidium subglaciale (strain EXF-2481) TaxID=1043005 RepID=A0A074Y7X6_AURSE|nr:uncharacterized protein AUEXF2481DRAFT_443766 [Aureobasidium subglaciale EXF-2481]KEQ92064.1 hypothetical protein AUEXF2481DRAFT_443766 [Aureobasidium subglaciale EXF-2481]
MTSSTAADAILSILNQSDTSEVAADATNEVSTPNNDSPLSSPPRSTYATPRSTRSSKRVHWEDTINDQSTKNLRRSTRGVPPKRLVESQSDAQPTRAQASRKRKTPVQQPQLSPILPKRSRKALSDVPNTLGKKKGSKPTRSTVLQPPTRAKPPTKPSSSKSTFHPSTPTRPTTTPPISTKSQDKRHRSKEKRPSMRPVQKSVVERATPTPPPPIRYKLHFQTKWCHRTLSNDDTLVRDTYMG